MFDRMLLPAGPHITPYLDEIERLHRQLAAYPVSDDISWLTVQAHRELVAASDREVTSRALFGDIFSWARFMLSSTVYRTLNLLDASVQAFNGSNYLAWVLLCRNLLELAAVFQYYARRVDDLRLVGPTFRATELQEAEQLLMRYARGTRYDWDALRRGLLGERHDASQYAKEPPAVRVGDALKDLAQVDSRFAEVKEVYGRFSDFAHPNMGSHMTVMDVQAEPTPGHHRCVLSSKPGALRGEFIMVATLPAATLALQKIAETLGPIGGIVSRWLDLMNGTVKSDFTR